MTKLNATANQRKNIRLLLAYLTTILPTALANDYSHDSFGTCTVGFAIRSGMFPDLVKNTKARNTIDYTITDDSAFVDIDELLEDVFGTDYVQNIIYSAKLDDVYEKNEGREQLECVVKAIRKEFNLTAKPLQTVTVVEQVDHTKNKIEQRIEQLTNYIKVASDLPDEYNRHTKGSIDAANTEINTLRAVLAI